MSRPIEPAGLPAPRRPAFRIRIVAAAVAVAALGATLGACQTTDQGNNARGAGYDTERYVRVLNNQR